MKQTTTITGKDLKDMFGAATAWLEKVVSDIDALNVFPVPDGDCGTNMLLTMRSSLEEAYRTQDGQASVVAKAMAKGALMGARGNSGVILSQIWRGIAQSLVDKESISGSDLAKAFTQASKTAYEGVNKPVEGTILTVMKEAAAAARAAVAGGADEPVSVMEAAVRAASEAEAKTPTLLPALREAGVVDAGGQGLYTLLEGALLYLKGQADQLQFRRPWIVPSSIPMSGRTPQMVAADEVPYGYCTEFMIKGTGLKPESLKSKLKKKGQSLIVVGDNEAIRVHIHTLDPGEILTYVVSIGTLHQVSIRNMDEQHRDFLEMQKERLPSVDMATVVVASGAGLIDVFKSLGASALVPGGQTMNPSTKELLQAVESVPSDKVIIIPNNKNIVPAANQVQKLTQKSIKVVPTETVPQGVAALLAVDYEADFDANAKAMEEAMSSVRTIEVTRSVRATRLNSLKIGKKQPIALLDGDLVAVAATPAEVLNKVLRRVEMSKAEIVTVYYGDDIKKDEAEALGKTVREKYPNLQVDIVNGGQPHYEYIISVE